MPSLTVSPKAVKASEAAAAHATEPPKPRQPASITVAAPVAADASITAAKKPVRRGAGLGARRKTAAAKKPNSTTIDWSKVGSDVPSGPVLPKVENKAVEKNVLNAGGNNTVDIAERFKGKKGISSDDFKMMSAYGGGSVASSGGSAFSSADFYPQRSSSRRGPNDSDDLVGMADGILRAATEGVAQAADEVTNAFSDFLNKGYA